jgi:hypothetical protein
MGRSPTNSRGIEQRPAESLTTFVTTFTDELILSLAASSTILVNASSRIKNKNQGQGSRHEITVDQQRRRALHRACSSMHLLRRGVAHAVKTCHFSRWLRATVRPGFQAPRRRACSRPSSASRRSASRWDGLIMVGQPIRCCSAISARPTIQVGDSFRQGM